MIHLDIHDYFPVGHIVKPHGLKGEMVAEAKEGFEDLLTESEYLLLEIDGGLVPFFVTEDGVHFRTATAFSFALDGIENADKVRPLCGCKIYLHNQAMQELEPGEELHELVGFTVFDTAKGKLGKITRIDDFSGNVVVTVQYKGAEILIPLSGELIADLDQEKKEIHINIPDGLIDIYLEK